MTQAEYAEVLKECPHLAEKLPTEMCWLLTKVHFKITPLTKQEFIAYCAYHILSGENIRDWLDVPF